jgi:hypothetical protein
MKLDLLTTQTIDRRNGGTLTYQLERGRVTGLLFATDSSFHATDTITIKLRHAGGVVLIADRVSAGMLAFLCDFKRGMPTRGTADTSPGDDDPLTAETDTKAKAFPLDAFELPIGHLTLRDAQLEITLNLVKAFGTVQRFKIYQVIGEMTTDVIYQYDASNDLESNHHLVREIYLVSKGQVPTAALGKYSFFNYLAVTGAPGGIKSIAKDVNILIDAEGEYFQNDVDGMGAITAIYGNLTGPPSTLLHAYADGDDLPTASMRVKVTGADKDMCYLLVIKELRIAQMAAASNVANAERVIQRTVALEKSNPDQAAAARAAGVTARSADLVQVAATLPQA